MKKGNELPQFTGPFRELIPKYISYKRAQGYKIGDPIVYRLREMDLFFKDRGVMDIRITREMYEEWTSHKPSLKGILSHMFLQMRKSAGYSACCKGTVKNRQGTRMMHSVWRCCCIIAVVSENLRYLIS